MGKGDEKLKMKKKKNKDIRRKDRKKYLPWGNVPFQAFDLVFFFVYRK